MDETNQGHAMCVDIVIHRRPGLIEAMVDGEMVGLQIKSGVCYGFNLTATRLWTLIERPTSLSTICATLVAEFVVDAPDCNNQVMQVLQDLRDEGLVDWQPSEPPPRLT